MRDWIREQVILAHLWVREHPQVVLAVIVAFCLGAIIVWGLASRMIDRMAKTHVKIVSAHNALEARYKRVNQAYQQLQRIREEDLRDRAAPTPPLEVAPTPAKRTRKKKSPATPEATSGRLWQEQLLDDGFDQEEPGK